MSDGMEAMGAFCAYVVGVLAIVAFVYWLFT